MIKPEINPMIEHRYGVQGASYLGVVFTLVKIKVDGYESAAAA